MLACRTWLIFGCLLSTASLAADVLPPPAAGTVRIATYNIQELNEKKLAQVDAQGRGTNPQLVAAATILQRVRPQVVLINEIDYTGPVDASGEPAADRDAARAFVERYLFISQQGLAPLKFVHRCYEPSNTGAPSGIDLNGDGQLGGPNDAYGFGRYPGEYSMVLLSELPLDLKAKRTFRKLLWKEMPGHLIPDGTSDRPAFYTPERLAVFRLSSKSHWDVPVTIGAKTVHLLCSHPTPPIFDGPEDAHGRRNHDELRFWHDYLTNGDAAKWIRDDADQTGGLSADASFVFLGDLNSDPVRSESDYGRVPIEWVIRHPRVSDPRPISEGAAEQTYPKGLQNYMPYKTSDFGRLDYVLPSRDLGVKATGVWWPSAKATHAAEAKRASDHRLVWADIEVP